MHSRTMLVRSATAGRAGSTGWSSRLLAALGLLVGMSAAPYALAQSMCVQPAEDVVSAVMLRAGANTSTAIVGRLAPDEQIELIGEVPYWYRIRLGDGSEAFASKRWTDLKDCRGGAIAVGEFQVRAVDVGTGLSILVTGSDFSLLYDAGSNDDLALRERNRVLAYLQQALPDLARLDHVVLSHPHRDHVELLADVFDAYEVADVWNSGAFNDICGYRALLRAIAKEPGVRYHTALMNYGDETVELAERCRLPAETVTLAHGARIDEEPITLGANASMRFLYIDGSKHTDFNDNSLVLQLNLGGRIVLIMGDAGGGSRKPPSAPPSTDSIEGVLLDCCADELKADVLVVGHHGSKTSSRTVFLDAVAASIFLVSSGPTKYSGTGLPDAEVIDELTRRGAVWRTDVDDAGCAENPNKTGEDADRRPGGCNNIVVHLSPQGITAAYESAP